MSFGDEGVTQSFKHACPFAKDTDTTLTLTWLDLSEWFQMTFYA